MRDHRRYSSEENKWNSDSRQEKRRLDELGFFETPSYDMTPEERAKWNEINERRTWMIGKVCLVIMGIIALISFIAPFLPY